AGVQEVIEFIETMTKPYVERTAELLTPYVAQGLSRFGTADYFTTLMMIQILDGGASPDSYLKAGLIQGLRDNSVPFFLIGVEYGEGVKAEHALIGGFDHKDNPYVGYLQAMGYGVELHGLGSLSGAAQGFEVTYTWDRGSPNGTLALEPLSIGF